MCIVWCRVHPECLAEMVNQELKEERYVTFNVATPDGWLAETDHEMIVYRILVSFPGGLGMRLKLYQL